MRRMWIAFFVVLSACRPSAEETFTKLDKPKIEEVVASQIIAKAEKRGLDALGFSSDGPTTVSASSPLSLSLREASGDSCKTFVVMCRGGKFIGLKIVAGRGVFLNYAPSKEFDLIKYEFAPEEFSSPDGKWCISKFREE